MDKKLVIIIPNELETNIRIFFSSCDWHHEGIFEFIYHNDINLYGKESEPAGVSSKALADQGFCVLLIDEFGNDRFLTAYVPIKISPKQLEYFNKRKEPLKSYDLSIALREQDDNYKLIDKSNTNQEIIDVLITELNNRLIKVNKTKTLIPKK